MEQEFLEKYPDIEEAHIVGYSAPNAVTSFESFTKYPDLNIKANNVTRKLKVTVISTVSEDLQLLHKLLTKARNI